MIVCKQENEYQENLKETYFTDIWKGTLQTVPSTIYKLEQIFEDYWFLWLKT